MVYGKKPKEHKIFIVRNQYNLKQMGTKAVSKLVYLCSIIISLTFMAITVAGAFSSYTDPNKHPLLGYIGTILPILILINLFYIIYWWIRGRIWIWFSLIGVLVNWGFITSMFKYSFDKENTEPTIKIATYNIRGFNNEPTGYSAKQIAGYMQKEQVDILCFQEFNANRYFNMDSLYNTFQKYPYKYIPRQSNGGTRIAIFSKYPIKDSLYISFDNSNNCGMWTDIKVKGKDIRLFNVHMQTTELNRNRHILAKEVQSSDSEREKEALENINRQIVNNQKIRANQAKLIEKYITKTEKPIILCGDFNDTPASYTYRTLKSNLKDGFRTCGKGYGYTFRGLLHLLRIDYIFHSDNLQGIEYYSPSLKWSDHNPIIMKVEL